MLKKFLVIAVPMIVVAIVSALMPGGSNGADSLIGISSEADYRQAIEKNQGQLAVFDFYADWCSPADAWPPYSKAFQNSLKERRHFTGSMWTPTRSWPGRPVCAHPFRAVRSPWQAGPHHDGPQPQGGLYPGPCSDFRHNRPIAATKGRTGSWWQGSGWWSAPPRPTLTVSMSTVVKRCASWSTTSPFPTVSPSPNTASARSPALARPWRSLSRPKQPVSFRFFATANCPSGNASRHGQVVVMPFAVTDRIAYAEIDAPAAKTLIAAQSPLILDVRTPGEYYSRPH